MDYLTEDHRKEAAAGLKKLIERDGMEKIEGLLGVKAITIESYVKNPFHMSVKFLHRANELLCAAPEQPATVNGGDSHAKEEEKGQEAAALPAVNAVEVLENLNKEFGGAPDTPQSSGDLDAQPDHAIVPMVGRDLCVIEPFYREVHPKCHIAMKDWYDPTMMRTVWKDQESFLVRTRNRLAAMFLKTGCQWSLWLDNDIITPCRPEMYRALVDKWTAQRVKDEFLNTPLPQRLMKWGKTIVSATYFDRHGHGSIMAVLRSRPTGKLPQNQLAPAVFSGMGCVLIHRKVFLDILTKFPELRGNKEADGREKEPNFFTPFPRPISADGKGGGTAGEDEAMFKRAADAGHPCYVDLGAICGHVGEYTYGLGDPKNPESL